jgi:folate-binding protein YgfZ
MASSSLHEYHQSLGARFTTVNGCEFVADYGDWRREHTALRATAAVIDLSARGRLCLTGADRVRFLNGQVTNDVKALATGEGCYAVLINAKGRMQSDLFVYQLPEELLLDFEPGFSVQVAARLEKYVIADDVQVVDAAPHYGLLSVQGPKASAVVNALALGVELPTKKPLSSVSVQDADAGDLYLMNQSRVGTGGFDLFIPVGALAAVADKLIFAAKALGGGACGWTALETARIEAGLPRFGVDMDDTNLPPEAGIEAPAISYTKGCYTGQEVIARIRTYGQVAKALRGLRLADDLPSLPARGDKLVHGGKEVGHVTNAVWSPALKANIAFGYVRREHHAVGTELVLRSAAGESAARVVELPFVHPQPAEKLPNASQPPT